MRFTTKAPDVSTLLEILGRAKHRKAERTAVIVVSTLLEILARGCTGVEIYRGVKHVSTLLEILGG